MAEELEKSISLHHGWSVRPSQRCPLFHSQSIPFWHLLSPGHSVQFIVLLRNYPFGTVLAPNEPTFHRSGSLAFVLISDGAGWPESSSVALRVSLWIS